MGIVCFLPAIKARGGDQHDLEAGRTKASSLQRGTTPQQATDATWPSVSPDCCVGLVVCSTTASNQVVQNRGAQQGTTQDFEKSRSPWTA